MSQRKSDGGKAPRVPDAAVAGVQRAKGAAHEAIGKLIGDDAAVDAGRREQRMADGHDPSREQDKGKQE